MYEPTAHAKLNRILDGLTESDGPVADRVFLTRLGANFYAIHDLFVRLYGDRDDCYASLEGLVRVLAKRYRERPERMRNRDREREANPGWFLEPDLVGMALYTDGFAKNIEGVRDRLDYFEELGVDLLHLMPLMRCPPGASDGGYAVSDFREVDPRVGTLEQVKELGRRMHERRMLLMLDVVINHTSNEHEWVQAARAGEEKYRDYYHTFEDREIPDQFEQTMPSIFPETAPGNFTWDEELQRWVMTVFNDYQWDLDYRNPAVFVEMIDIVLFWANCGADVLRLDAVAFIWKQLGTACQNLPEAHLLLQLFTDCCQVSAPGLLLVAEAIVAPTEIAKYFGEDAVVARECDIAYNATLMALLWDGVATQNAKLLRQGIKHLPVKLSGSTWLNYLRCHDDIGLGFDDADIVRAGYDPWAHRRFLLDYFTGVHDWSDARGQRFGENPESGDARIAGSLASLVGLEAAMERGDAAEIDLAIDRILMLHAVIMSFNGIPLLYYGDELGTFNDDSYLEDPHRSSDARWLHRPRLDDADRARREVPGSPARRIFDGLTHLIRTRRGVAAFTDRDDRVVLEFPDEHLLAYTRGADDEAVIVVANFDREPHEFRLDHLPEPFRRSGGQGFHDLLRDEDVGSTTVEIAGYSARWLVPKLTPTR